MNETIKTDEINTESLTGTVTIPTEQKTFDDLLKNPEYQREFDKKLEGARQKWEAKWQEKAEAEKTEAERLAKLSETERFQDEISKLKAQNDELIRNQNASALKDEALKIATKEGVDVKFLDLFDFTREDAQSIKDKINILKENMEASVTNRVNERLKQPAPQQHNETHEKKSFNRASF